MSSKLSRGVRTAVKQGNFFPAVVMVSANNRATVRLSGNGAQLSNLKVIGGPVDAGDQVNVDFTTNPPTVVATGERFDPSTIVFPKAFRKSQLLRPTALTNGILHYVAGKIVEVFNPDSAGLTACFGKAGTGSVVFIPNGIYMANYTIPAGASVIGLSRDGTVLFGLHTVGAGCYLEQLTFKYDATVSEPWSRIISTSGDVQVIDCNIYGQTQDAQEYPLIGIGNKINTGGFLDIRECEIQTNSFGAFLDSPEDIDWLTLANNPAVPNNGYRQFNEMSFTELVSPWQEARVWYSDEHVIHLRSEAVSGYRTHFRINGKFEYRSSWEAPGWSEWWDDRYIGHIHLWALTKAGWIEGTYDKYLVGTGVYTGYFDVTSGSTAYLFRLVVDADELSATGVGEYGGGGVLGLGFGPEPWTNESVRGSDATTVIGTRMWLGEVGVGNEGKLNPEWAGWWWFLEGWDWHLDNGIRWVWTSTLNLQGFPEPLYARATVAIRGGDWGVRVSHTYIDGTGTVEGTSSGEWSGELTGANHSGFCQLASNVGFHAYHTPVRKWMYKSNVRLESTLEIRPPNRTDVYSVEIEKFDAAGHPTARFTDVNFRNTNALANRHGDLEVAGESLAEVVDCEIETYQNIDLASNLERVDMLAGDRGVWDLNWETLHASDIASAVYRRHLPTPSASGQVPVSVLRADGTFEWQASTSGSDGGEVAIQTAIELTKPGGLRYQYPVSDLGLQAAINAAEVGDRLTLPTGTYYGNLLLPAGITLTADGSVIFSHTVQGNTGTAIENIRMVLDDVTSGSLAGILAPSEGITTLRDVTVRVTNQGDGPAYGIWGNGAGSLVLHDCDLEAISSGSDGAGGWGAYLGEDASGNFYLYGGRSYGSSAGFNR